MFGKRVVSSPLSRCTTLARAFALQADVELAIEPTLVEMDFGDFDGVSFDSMAPQQWQKLEPFWSAPATCVLPNAESLEDFHHPESMNVKVIGQPIKHFHLIP